VSADHGRGIAWPAFAAVAAFLAGLGAVAQHAACTSAGYALAVAECEGAELRRLAGLAQRRVEAVQTAQAALARAKAMNLTLDWPRTWNVVRKSTLETQAAAASQAPSEQDSAGSDR
jgi:hypothetical protein